MNAKYIVWSSSLCSGISCMKEWVLFLMKEVILYTDGACRGNPGPGGWAAILQFGEHERVMSGGAVDTTNNRMEIMGLVQGLSVLKEPC